MEYKKLEKREMVMMKTNKVIYICRKSNKVDMRLYKKIDDNVVFYTATGWLLVYFFSTVFYCAAFGSDISWHKFFLYVFGFPVLTYVLLKILVWRNKLVVMGTKSYYGFDLYWRRSYSPLVHDDEQLYYKIVNWVAKQKGFIPGDD